MLFPLLMLITSSGANEVCVLDRALSRASDTFAEMQARWTWTFPTPTCERWKWVSPARSSAWAARPLTFWFTTCFRARAARESSTERSLPERATFAQFGTSWQGGASPWTAGRHCYSLRRTRRWMRPCGCPPRPRRSSCGNARACRRAGVHVILVLLNTGLPIGQGRIYCVRQAVLLAAQHPS